MLTVKQVQTDGAEEVFEVEGKVRYEPDECTVWIETEDEGRIGLPSGVVYVMNQAGQTVARYDLSVARRKRDQSANAAGQMVGGLS